MKWTKKELTELKNNATFQKLREFIVNNSMQCTADTDSEVVAKQAMMEAGRMDVFRTVDAILAEMSKATPKPMETMIPFEHSDEEGSVD
tara:strand:- start:87 stop:353 length:267 start_codon:yes stop_codon:yes gene_type:complete